MSSNNHVEKSVLSLAENLINLQVAVSAINSVLIANEIITDDELKEIQEQLLGMEPFKTEMKAVRDSRKRIEDLEKLAKDPSKLFEMILGSKKDPKSSEDMMNLVDEYFSSVQSESLTPEDEDSLAKAEATDDGTSVPLEEFKQHLEGDH